MDSQEHLSTGNHRASFLNFRPGFGLTAALLFINLLLSPTKLRAGDALYIDSGKTLRMEQRDDGIYLVRLKDESQQAKLPVKGEESPDEFHLSPDGAWLYGLRHVGSGNFDVFTDFRNEEPVCTAFWLVDGRPASGLL